MKKMYIIMVSFLLCLNSYAAIVSDNDGSAFVTKAEFDAMKTSFSQQVSDYENSITNKIDGAIASYLAGIKVSKESTLDLKLDINGKYGDEVLRWSSSTSGRRDKESKKYLSLDIVHKDIMWYTSISGTSTYTLQDLRQEMHATIKFPLPSSGKRTTDMTYNTWCRNSTTGEDIFTPGILTPKANVWIFWIEYKNQTDLSGWHTGANNYVTGMCKRNQTVSTTYTGWYTASDYATVTDVADVSAWDTDISGYTVYPKSTSKEYCFTDDESYTATANIDGSGSCNVETYGDYSVTPIKNLGTGTSKCSTGFSIDSNVYNPSFALDSGIQSANMKIQNWLDVSDKNKLVKNGIYLGTIGSKINGFSFKAKAEKAGKLYLYFGDSVIDIPANTDKCYEFDITDSLKKFKKTEDIDADKNIYALYLPTDTSVESYIGIQDFIVTTE